MVAKESGAEIFNNKIRQGYSKSLEKGIFKAKGLGFSHVISLDADGELSPLHIKKFLKLFESHTYYSSYIKLSKTLTFYESSESH